MKLNSKNIFFQLLSYGPPKSQRQFIRLCVLQILVSLADLFSIAMLMSVMAMAVKSQFWIDLLAYFNMADPGKNTILIILVIGSLGAFVIKNTFAYKVTCQVLSFSEKFSSHLNDRLVRAFFTRGYSFFKDEKIFKITHRTASLPFEFASVTIKAVLSILAQLALCTVFVIFSFIVDFEIAVFLLIGSLPLVLLMFYKHRSKSVAFGQEKNEKLPSNNRALHKLYESFLELKIYGAENLFIKNFLHHLNGFNAVRFKQQKLITYPRRVLETVAIALILSLFVLRVIVDANADAFLLDILVLGVFGYKIIPAIANILDGLVVLSTTRDAQLSLLENLQPANRQHTSEEISTIQTIQLDKICFDIKSRSILKDISIQLQRGEILGIVGKSGEGKSTLLKIFMGFLEANKGTALINGREVSLYNSESWFRKLGFIGDDSTLLDMTIYENVGLKPYTDLAIDRVEHAIMSAGLGSFIGADREVGEDGNKLSTGERQRLALARALYHQPEILILDEFTSHLDDETEHGILQSIQEINKSQGTIILMVSHRKSTMTIAHRILKLEKGVMIPISE